MKVAVVGCLHGELHTVYRVIQYIEQTQGYKIDLVLCCGDFQAVRDPRDLRFMTVPPKYLRMGDFPDYFEGRATAPIPTIFVGGNHEASAHLWELFNGGWVAHNIWYLGHAGVVNFGGLRIAGWSGIYKAHEFQNGYVPVTEESCDEANTYAAYHVREYHEFLLSQITHHVDVFLSHDWPRGAVENGNKAAVCGKKHWGPADLETVTNIPMRNILDRLQPNYWFAAHHHIKHPAIFKHENGKMTKFLALGKVLPGNEFLQILDINPETPSQGPAQLCYDPEWLEIVHRCACFFPLGRGIFTMPSPFSYPPITDERIKEITEKLGDKIVIKGSPAGERPEPTQQQSMCFQTLLQSACGEFVSNQQTDAKTENPEEILLDN